jgi:hypothetical protein
MEVRSAARRRRVVRLTATAVAVLFLLVLPAAKAVAQTGSLSMESFVDALHGSLQHVHYIIYCLWQSL